MGGRIRYTEEFKLGAVAGRLGVSTKSLYDWVKRYGGQADDVVISADTAEIKRLKAELRKGPPVKYAFIKAHRDEFSVRAMCRVLKVHVSGLSGQAKPWRGLHA